MAAKKNAAKKKSAKKKAAKKKGAKAAKRKTAAKSANRRELIDTGTNKLFVRRNERGTSFKEVVDVSRSLRSDRRQKARTVSKPGQGDRGDRARR
ncbi:hypothetical protein LJ725_25790 [Reyranella aquatilis]|uniref:Uncharacterized protein n=1 Tax=Reyranella aquatilis TaxID=2035356 RepID=A0ABS8L367_9HYPH|nr:hypothetical protein [Reyranella aquatilis]MCC8432402.1 hypothetical protein [Reyranella aquatilis]